MQHDYVRREHADGTSQELDILRAERSSAPTDLRRRFERHTDLRCENLCAIQNCIARIYTS